MSSMEEIKNTFMTSFYPPSLFKPRTMTISFERLSDICSQRLKLYVLLQKVARESVLYSEQWTLLLVKALAKEQFEPFYALLDRKKTSELLVDSLAECKDGGLAAESNSTESAPKCKDGGLAAESNSTESTPKCKDGGLAAESNSTESAPKCKDGGLAAESNSTGSAPKCKDGGLAAESNSTESAPKCKDGGLAAESNSTESTPKCKDGGLAAESNSTESAPKCKDGGLAAESNSTGSAPKCKDGGLAAESNSTESAPKCKDGGLAAESNSTESAPKCKDGGLAAESNSTESAPKCKDGGLAAESNSTESAPKCKAKEPLTDLSLEDYFMDDAIGHFFVGLMSGDELKRHFVDMEIQWFQLKCNVNVPVDSLIDFLTYNNLDIPEEASKTEILSITDLLSIYDLDFESDIPPGILKLPYCIAPQLIANRKVAIKDGILYFPLKREYIRVLTDHYLKDKWMQRVAVHSQRWLRAKSRDERYNRMIFDVFTPHLKKILNYNGGVEGGILTLENINEHASNLFPLCMSEIHNSLQKNNHLHHFARKQYAVFLKHAGMFYEHAMELFKSEFTKKMTAEEYRKQKYEYYFSHCYGQVGSFINYPPQNCHEIINYGKPICKQEHGCPFAHSDEKSLTDILKKHDISLSTITEIINSKKNEQYSHACYLYFTAKCGRPLASGNSPNAYYACALEKEEIADIEDIFPQK